jgi:hypothetical protein
MLQVSARVVSHYFVNVPHTKVNSEVHASLFSVGFLANNFDTL